MITSFTRLLCFMLLAPFGVTAQAQETQEERWYRVELLVFSRTQPASQNAETWDPTPTLQYPESYQFLIDPNTPAASKYPTDPNLPALNVNSAVSPSSPRPTPLALLSPTDRLFQDDARKMQRSGQYQVLFHESWLQPVLDRATAVDIVLDQSGDTAQWPELQGSIKLYLSRYLHLETNLWLNTAGEYLPQDWQMPAPPLGPVSRPASDLQAPPNIHDPQADSVIAGELPPPTDPLLSAMGPVEEDNVAPVYPWRHALLLKQERRMRSTEIHYIDHPALGAIIQIMPVEEELLQWAGRESNPPTP